MSRSYPERPYVGIGAVIFRGGDVLLVQRSKPPKEGAWSLPGGAQKIGETAEEALAREIAEETGLDFTPTGFLEVVDFIERDGAKEEEGEVRHHYTLLDYWGVSDHGEITAGGDAADARWVPLADIDKYGMWEKTVEVIQMADALRQGSGSSTALAPHSVKGHLNAIGWALVFGMGAYAVFMTLITLTRWAGLLE